MLRLRAFESPRSFARTCVRLAVGLAILGVAGLLDRMFVFPLAALLLAFAALAWLAGTDGFVDPPPPPEEPVEAIEPVEPVEPVGAVTPPVDAVTPPVERTFRLPASVGAERVWLVGDLNGWSPTAHPMRRIGDWFTVTVELEPGRTYRYRYLLDADRWENDWDADAYVPNDFGTDDSVART